MARRVMALWNSIMQSFTRYRSDLKNEKSSCCFLCVRSIKRMWHTPKRWWVLQMDCIYSFYPRRILQLGRTWFQKHCCQPWLWNNIIPFHGILIIYPCSNLNADNPVTKILDNGLPCGGVTLLAPGGASPVIKQCRLPVIYGQIPYNYLSLVKSSFCSIFKQIWLISTKTQVSIITGDIVMTWKRFPEYCPFCVKGISLPHSHYKEIK